MTLAVKISINGNYQSQYRVNDGEPVKITGIKSEGPREYYVNFHHGQPLKIEVDPDEYVGDRLDDPSITQPPS